MIRISLALVCTGMAAVALAQETTHWRVTGGSSLRFQALQQGAEFTGTFEEFDAQIRFSRDDVAQSTLTVVVEMDSVDTAYDDRDEALRSADFFAVEQWPRAIFEASEFRDLGADRFEVVGDLTIRDQTRSVTVPFGFTDEGGIVRLAGEIVISRLDFGIGQGEWTSTEWVGRDVTVLFDLGLEGPDVAAETL